MPRSSTSIWRTVLESKGDGILQARHFSILRARKIFSKAPSEYFDSVVPKAQRKAICEANILPLRAEIYANNDYDTFLKQRAEQVLAYLDSLVS